MKKTKGKTAKARKKTSKAKDSRQMLLKPAEFGQLDAVGVSLITVPAKDGYSFRVSAGDFFIDWDNEKVARMTARELGKHITAVRDAAVSDALRRVKVKARRNNKAKVVSVLTASAPSEARVGREVTRAPQHFRSGAY